MTAVISTTSYLSADEFKDLLSLVDAEVPCVLMLSGKNATKIIPRIKGFIPQADLLLNSLMQGGGFSNPEEVGNAIKSFTILFYDGTYKKPSMSLKKKGILIETGEKWDVIYSKAFEGSRQIKKIKGIPVYKAGDNELFLKIKNGKFLYLYEYEEIGERFAEVFVGKRKSLAEVSSIQTFLKNQTPNAFFLLFPAFDSFFWGNLNGQKLILGGNMNLLLMNMDNSASNEIK